MEPTLHEVKTALEESNRLFEGQFKAINRLLTTTPRPRARQGALYATADDEAGTRRA